MADTIEKVYCTFQFHKGTIRTIFFQVFSLAFQDFNSIKVQLELHGFFQSLDIREFQFHKGTIRTKDAQQAVNAEQNFNSIKVQLELISPSTSGSSTIFQFHKGTIRTVISITSFLFFANFNSIKVQLELYLHSYLRQSRQNFNSIKVQLEHDSVFRQVFQPLFQFHKGTIRTQYL